MIEELALTSLAVNLRKVEMRQIGNISSTIIRLTILKTRFPPPRLKRIWKRGLATVPNKIITQIQASSKKISDLKIACQTRVQAFLDRLRGLRREGRTLFREYDFSYL